MKENVQIMQKYINNNKIYISSLTFDIIYYIILESIYSSQTNNF